MLRGVVIRESIVMGVRQGVAGEIPLESAERAVVVLPAGMPRLCQVIEQVHELVVGDRDLAQNVDWLTVLAPVFDALNLS